MRLCVFSTVLPCVSVSLLEKLAQTLRHVAPIVTRAWPGFPMQFTFQNICRMWILATWREQRDSTNSDCILITKFDALIIIYS